MDAIFRRGIIHLCRVMADAAIPLPPPPIANPMHIDECEQYWEQFKKKLGKLAGKEGEILANLQKEARTLYRQYNRCMMQKRPGHLRRSINSRTEEAIRMNRVGENGPLNGGRRRTRRRGTRK